MDWNPEVVLGSVDPAFNEELNSESGRGAAIVGAALLDDLLGSLLDAVLIDDGDARAGLLNSRGPLSSSYARAQAAYCLGLISRAECRELNRIRHVRNSFAHAQFGLTFDDHEVSKWCEKLSIVREAIGDDAWSHLVPRKRYEITVAMLAGQFQSRAGERSSTRPLSPSLSTPKAHVYRDGEWHPLHG